MPRVMQNGHPLFPMRIRLSACKKQKGSPFHAPSGSRKGDPFISVLRLLIQQNVVLRLSKLHGRKAAFALKGHAKVRFVCITAGKRHLLQRQRSIQQHILRLLRADDGQHFSRRFSVNFLKRPEQLTSAEPDERRQLLYRHFIRQVRADICDRLIAVLLRSVTGPSRPVGSIGMLMLKESRILLPSVLTTRTSSLFSPARAESPSMRKT